MAIDDVWVMDFAEGVTRGSGPVWFGPRHSSTTIQKTMFEVLGFFRVVSGFGFGVLWMARSATSWTYGIFFSTQHYKINHCQVTLCTYGVITGVTTGLLVRLGGSLLFLAHLHPFLIVFFVCFNCFFRGSSSHLLGSSFLPGVSTGPVLRPWIGFIHHANVVECDHPGQDLHLFLVFCSPVPKSRSRCRTSHAMLSTHIQLQRNLLHARGPQGSGSSGTTRRDCICQ